MTSNLEIQVKNLDHLGLVAGIIDEIGIVEQINELVGEQPGEIVSPGHAVKAMIQGRTRTSIIASVFVFLQFSQKAATKIEQLSGITYQVQAQLEPETEKVERETWTAGRFVLATNVLEVKELSNDEMLSKYKEQQASERGFAFLKDLLFFTDSVFLKSPERVSALALLMGFCLLVYTLAQRQLRQTLKQSQSRLKNQLGK